MDILKNQGCPFCRKKTLTLTNDEQDIPFFGKVFIFSMACESCKMSKSDVEAAERKDPVKITFETNDEKDMKVRVVKSSEATIKIPSLKMEVTPGIASEGYVSNIEGVLNKFSDIVDKLKNDAEDEAEKKKVKVLSKKLWKVKLGDIPCKIIIEDPSGNSAIISEKSVIEKLKVKKK